MTIHNLLEKGWRPPNSLERVLSLTQVRDTVIIITDSNIYRAEENYGNFIVVMLGLL